ncbi:MAG: hypothetical protein ACYDCN_09605 [Bacteroidia bacterium]
MVIKKITKNALWLLVLTLLVRIFTVYYVGKFPCMEASYFEEAKQLFSDSDKINLFYPPAYPILLVLFQNILSSEILSSWWVYIFFSSFTSLILYLLIKEMFDENISLIAIILLIFLPNISVAVAGYSHTLTVGSFFLISYFYFLWKIWNSDTLNFKYIVLAVFFALSACFFRPDNLLIIFGLICVTCLYIIFSRKKTNYLWSSTIIIISIAAGLFTHSICVKEKSNSKITTIFSEAQYSYLTFTHTLSLRAGKGINDSIATRLGTIAFGTPTSNNYSILKAIKKNYNEEIRNLIYNVKELLDNFAHPLFLPFFLYFFVGTGIIYLCIQNKTRHLLYLGSILILSPLPLLIFHVEIRYMMTLTFPIIIFASVGIGTVENKKVRNAILIATISLLFIVYLSYLITFSMLDNLCG